MLYGVGFPGRDRASPASDPFTRLADRHGTRPTQARRHRTTEACCEPQSSETGSRRPSRLSLQAATAVHKKSRARRPGSFLFEFLLLTLLASAVRSVRADEELAADGWEQPGPLRAWIGRWDVHRRHREEIRNRVIRDKRRVGQVQGRLIAPRLAVDGCEASQRISRRIAEDARATFVPGCEIASVMLFGAVEPPASPGPVQSPLLTRTASLTSMMTFIDEPPFCLSPESD